MSFQKNTYLFLIPYLRQYSQHIFAVNCEQRDPDPGNLLLLDMHYKGVKGAQHVVESPVETAEHNNAREAILLLREEQQMLKRSLIFGKHTEIKV